MSDTDDTGDSGIKSLDERVLEVLAIEAEDAKRAGALGYMARALTLATLPHREVPGHEFKRENGLFRLSILAPSDVGLPFGSIPRLLLSWLTTEAVRTGSPVLELGPTLSAFMAKLDLARQGGKRGDITRFRNQTVRLFSSMVSLKYSNNAIDFGAGFNIAKNYSLWWDPKSPDQLAFWTSTVTLGTDFFQDIIKSPVPVDLRALKCLKQSPMALDIYCWLTHRMFYLEKEIEIPWRLLQMQCGAGYALDGRGPLDFKRNFLLRLKKVHEVYPQANVGVGKTGLILRPNPPHVAPIPTKGMGAAERRRRVLVGKRADAVQEKAAALLLGDMGNEKPLLPPPRVGPPLLILQTETYEKAKRATRRAFDVYTLEQEWREWIIKKDRYPNDPDGAFIGFCMAKYKQLNR